MQIQIDLMAVDDCTKQDINIQRFLSIFEERSKTAPQFDACLISSVWGLLVFSFFRPTQKVRVPVSLDVFLLTQGEVVSDTGKWVSRWDRLAEQIFLEADSKMAKLIA